MNEPEKTQQKKSSVFVLILGGVMLLLGLLIFTVSWIALEESEAGFVLIFLYLFVVYPLLITGGLLVLRSLLRKRSNVFILI